jgi:hypothetical protein
VTAWPARFNEVAMPYPIEPSPTTAMRWFCELEADMQLTLANVSRTAAFATARDLE